jgi:hypothetical protein
MSRETPTLGAGRAHVYVTRAATLAYRDSEITAGWGVRPFEEARRVLMEHLLRAVPVPGDLRRWTFRTRSGEYVAYVVPDGDLLVVGNVSLAQDAPRVHCSGPPSEASP